MAAAASTIPTETHFRSSEASAGVSRTTTTTRANLAGREAASRPKGTCCSITSTVKKVVAAVLLLVAAAAAAVAIASVFGVILPFSAFPLLATFLGLNLYASIAYGATATITAVIGIRLLVSARRKTAFREMISQMAKAGPILEQVAERHKQRHNRDPLLMGTPTSGVTPAAPARSAPAASTTAVTDGAAQIAEAERKESASTPTPESIVVAQAEAGLAEMLQHPVEVSRILTEMLKEINAGQTLEAAGKAAMIANPMMAANQAESKERAAEPGELGRAILTAIDQMVENDPELACVCSKTAEEQAVAALHAEQLFAKCVANPSVMFKFVAPLATALDRGSSMEEAFEFASDAHPEIVAWLDEPYEPATTQHLRENLAAAGTPASAAVATAERPAPPPAPATNLDIYD